MQFPTVSATNSISSRRLSRSAKNARIHTRAASVRCRTERSLVAQIEKWQQLALLSTRRAQLCELRGDETGARANGQAAMRYDDEAARLCQHLRTQGGGADGSYPTRDPFHA